MNLSAFASGDDVFVNCECIKGYAFKKAISRGKSAILADAAALLQDICTQMAVMNASRRIPTC